MGIKINLVGEQFGRLTVIEQFLKPNNSNTKKQNCCLCVCDCGEQKIIPASYLRKGDTRSCGCLHKESITNHGLRHHPLYHVWDSMKQRCYNPKSKAYKNYGGRGVFICDEWLEDFMSFYNWAINNGWQKGLCLDKDIIKKDNLCYCPKYCRFVTHKRNNNATRRSVYFKYKDKDLTLSEIATLSGANRHTLWSKAKRGDFSFLV